MQDIVLCFLKISKEQTIGALSIPQSFHLSACPTSYAQHNTKTTAGINMQPWQWIDINKKYSAQKYTITNMHN